MWFRILIAVTLIDVLYRTLARPHVRRYLGVPTPDEMRRWFEMPAREVGP